MKTLVLSVSLVVMSLMALPVLFTNGDAEPIECTGSVEVDAVLATIRTVESGGNYSARAARSTASGAYQFLDSTWAGYGGYEHAWRAPASVQDAKAERTVSAVLDDYDGDVTAVPVVWYIGRVPPATSPAWDLVPAQWAGNVLTPREYRDHWMVEFDRQRAAHDGGIEPVSCLPPGGIAVLENGYAYPAPFELFATAPTDTPHHDYPAWDWTIPTGTPIYAIHGGRVGTVQYWPHNWWDEGCGNGAAGCRTCGVGVTIVDDDGVRWTYCHGSAVHVRAGDVVTAGSQILTSGNTGRSSGPHLHLQIRTPDGVLRCPQTFLRSLRDGRLTEALRLPSTGCEF